MLRPFNPNDAELRRLDRIVTDSGTGLLYVATFAIVYVAYLIVQLVTALPRMFLRRAAHIVHGLHRPA